MIDFKEDWDDYINDKSFLSWVYGSNESDVQKWEKWIQNNPDKEALVNEIADVLRLSEFKEKEVSKEQLSKAEARLRAAMEASAPPAKVVNIKRKRVWYSVAAILVVCLAVGLTYFLQTRPVTSEQIASNYGKVLKNELPDGTEVILNANSKLTLGKTWQEGKTREVWVKGEVFFHVRKTPTHDKFIVHTDAFDIEVTGTSFNVKNKDGKSSIILKQGSVIIHRKGEPDIKMKPGDYVAFENNQIQKTTVTKDDYLLWTQNKLVFDDTPLSSVANTIKEHYGVEVQLVGDSVRNITISGILPNNNLDVLIASLEALQEFNISRTDDAIIISGKNQ